MRKTKLYEREITASHPCTVNTPLALECDWIAMNLVGERYNKR